MTTTAPPADGDNGEGKRAILQGEAAITVKPAKGTDELAEMSGMASDHFQSAHWSKEQARRIRRTLFVGVGQGYAKSCAWLVFGMMLLLLAAMYTPLLHILGLIFGTRCTPLLVTMAGEGASWPLTAFIVGTFVSFIAFSVLLFSVIAPSRRKKEDDKEGVKTALTAAANAVGGAGAG